MKSDIEIARSATLKPIAEVAKSIGIDEADLIPYGRFSAKIDKQATSPNGKLILVTAINPTKAGIGKTTVSIGLADGIKALDGKVCLALREPSLGPVFGIKGGATGGGYSQVVPMEEINLHFNGDFHAITSANNLLCSLIDNHIYWGNELDIDPNHILFKRCVDLNERALRDVTLNSGTGRHDHFTITSASEIMAIVCMSENLKALKERLGNIMVALNRSGRPVYAKDLGAVDSMAILLKDAIKPNLVQTLNGTPAIIHGGPFANIAHGANSVLATKLAMEYADYAVTEAGFGADLGAEKFIDFKCRHADIKPDCVVLVATIRALKLHGGEDETNLENENLEALRKGLSNLIHHVNVIKNVYGLPIVVTLNRYSTDTIAEIDLVQKSAGVEVVLNDVWGKGAQGALTLAKKVMEECERKSELHFAYDLDDSIEDKISKIVTRVYGGESVIFTKEAREAFETIKKEGLAKLPIIIAKTQFSLSADKNLIGAPKDFTVEVKDIEIRSGAGFLVVICGSMLLMPALSRNPSALSMRISDDGIIDGLF